MRHPRIALGSGLVVLLALAAAPVSRPGVELAAYNLQLRRAALAMLEAHEPARRADPESLVLFSFTKDAVLAGTATGPRQEGDGTLGFAYLSADAGEITAGVYELKLQRSGIVVDLVDERGRVVASVTLDPPFPGSQQQARVWPEAFLTIARWMATRFS
jgi:hypothetical protein